MPKYSKDEEKRQRTRRVEIFKSECKDAKYYEKACAECERHIEEIENAISGIHSPTWDKIGTSTSFHTIDHFGLMEKREYWENKRDVYKEMLDWILECISGVKPGVYKPYVISTCLCGNTVEKTAYEIETDPVHFSVNLYNAIANGVTDDMIAKRELIKNRMRTLKNTQERSKIRI